MLDPGKQSSSLSLIVLAAITVAGALLRLYELSFQSLWFDELHTVIRSDPSNSLQSILGYAKDSEVDQPPAFFLYTQVIFTLLGVSEWTVRFASVLLGIIAIPVMFLLGREVRDTNTGLIASALTSLNYFHIVYSQEARFYTMTFLLSAVSYLFFFRAYKYEQLRDYVLYVLFTCVLLYTHYFGMVIFASQIVTFLILAMRYKPEKKFLISGVVSGLMVLILFLPWVSIVLKHMQVGAFWIQKPGPLFFLEYFYGYVGKDIVQAIILAFLTFVFARAYFRQGAQNISSSSVAIIMVLWLILSYLIPFVRSLISTPVLHIRYSIITLPAWIIIFSMGWSSIKNQRVKIALLICLVISSVVNLVAFRKHFTSIQKQQIREVSHFVQKANPEVPVYAVFADHFSFYFPGNRPVQSVEVADFSRVDKFWLLQAYFFSVDEYAQELEKFRGDFVVAEEQTFHKTKAVLMVKKNQPNSAAE